MQPASVAVPDQGREAEAQQDRAQQGAQGVDRAGVQGEDPQAEQALARGEAEGADGQHADDEEEEQRPVPGRLAVAVGDQAVCDQGAQTPVDGEGAQAPAGARDGSGARLGQAQLLSAVSEVGTGVLGGRAGSGQPRSDCLPVVHPSTVLRPFCDADRWGTPDLVRLTWAKQMGHAGEITRP